MLLDVFGLAAVLIAIAPLCAIAGFATGGSATLFSAGIEDERRGPMVRRAYFLPAAILLALLLVLTVQDQVDTKILHRFASVAPLAGDYVLNVDYNDSGTISASRSSMPPNVVELDGEGDDGPYMWHSQTVGIDDALGNVTRLQVADPLIAGAYRLNGDGNGHDPERYFLFDTRSGATALFSNWSDFAAAAARRHIALALESAPDAFAHHRAWLDWTADRLYWAIPTLALLWLVVAPLRLRWQASHS